MLGLLDSHTGQYPRTRLATGDRHAISVAQRQIAVENRPSPCQSAPAQRACERTGKRYWRAGADDDEHYVYAIAL
jgi:hypothetical protein